ncbi:hypothetical protein SELMODRAFT_406306 [Selaginella moellendorffii]|uniref:BRCT domain-containing protein n=1 Tax=Selaginella moellendorffii TaxID=88036 RepID=D8R1Y3_SELML|nr:hypothetical protein SELMODRAFT_406306 [Selaginella moellendorffii]
MASSSTIAIGNCSVEISGDIDYEKNGRRVSFSIPGLGTVRVSAADSTSIVPVNPNALDIARTSIVPVHPHALDIAPTSIVPLNPVALDTTGQQLLGDALDLYTGEFSTSCRAYISGCVKDGKNVTLVLAEHQHASDQTLRVIDAYALFSLQGLGTRLCIEFQRRLCDIGVSTVYCFAGRSESFWSKQASSSEKYVDMYSLLCLKQGFKPLADGSTKPKFSEPLASFFTSDTKVMIFEKFPRAVQGSTEPSATQQHAMQQHTDPPGTSKAVRKKGTSKRKRNEKGDPSCQPLLAFSQPPRDSPDTAAGKDVEPIQTCGERSPVVLFMNMADEQRKRQLTKVQSYWFTSFESRGICLQFVETLGGQVTDTGSKCTHVLTGQVRRTMNFCAAVSVGAWILSPEWLRSSVEAKTFVDPIPFVLEDADFKANYNTDVASVIKRARAKPLFQGLQACLTPHIDQVLRELIESGCGKVVSRIEELTMPVSKSFVISCKADAMQARNASSVGLRVFDTEWLIRSVMKQELDIEVKDGLTIVTTVT